MKKLLALVLALVMTLGLATVSTNAATFTDSDKIEHHEAIDILSELGVIDGMGDGTFNPEGNVTRAQMAKMISIILLGSDVDASAFAGASSNLTDVNGTWAEGFIKYCVSQGIIVGKGNGIFDPNANVTTAEAAKMLLVAIGYNADVQGYVGSDWAINVLRDAAGKKLLEDLSGMSANKAITRDEAAQMIWNSIQRNTITKSPSQERTSDGKVTDTYYDGGDPLLASTFNGRNSVNGIMTDILYNSVKDEYGYEINGGNIYWISNKDYSDLFGMDVTVLENTKANKNEYALYVHEGSLIATSYESELELDKLASDKEIKADGTTYKTTNATMAVLEFNNGTYQTAGAIDTSRLAEVRLIDTTDDNKVDTIVYRPFTLSQITYIGGDNITFKNVGNEKKADISIYEGAAKDDWVKRYASVNTAKAENTYTKVERVDGSVTSYKNQSGAKYLVGGSWLKDTTGKLTQADVGSSISYIAFGKSIYDVKVTSGAKGVDDLVLVTDFSANSTTGGKSTSWTSQLLFADGTKVTGVKLVDSNGNAVNPAAFHGLLASYEKDGSDYILTLLDSTHKAGFESAGKTTDAALTLVNSGTTIKTVSVAGGSSYEIDDNAVVFWMKADAAGRVSEAKIKTGKELKSLSAPTYATIAQAFGTEKSSGFETVKVIAVKGLTGADYPTFTVGNTYGYLTADAYTAKEDGKNYVYYTMWTANGEVTAKEEGGAGKLTDKVAGNVVMFNNVDSNGIVKSLRVVDISLGAVTGWDEAKKISVLGTTNATTEITADTQIIYVNSSDKEGVSGGSISIAADDGKTPATYTNNVRYVFNAGKDRLDVIIVDVNNNMKGATNATLADNSTAAAITTAFATADKVTIGTETSIAGITVPAGKTLVVNNLTAVAMNVNGTLEVNTLTNATAAITGTGKIKVGTITAGAANLQTAKVQVTAANTAANIEAIPAAIVTELTLDAKTTTAGTAGKWIDTDGVTNLTVSGGIPVGIYAPTGTTWVKK